MSTTNPNAASPLSSMAALLTLAGLLGCAGTPMPLPPPLETTPRGYVIKDVSDGNAMLDADSTRYYWVEEPQWDEPTRHERKLSKSVSVQDIMRQPYFWTRRTRNNPVVRLRRDSGWMFILFIPIPTGETCYALPLHLEQQTLSDVDANPSAFDGEKGVEAAWDYQRGEQPVECDKFHSIASVYAP